ncbi:hypothetical protein JCM18903_1311 [Psychrobacter sp. JCM 18903]|nr:hypothetical protein JCM18903_1311 [Psychrobacter sp. JCM 18903]
MVFVGCAATENTPAVKNTAIDNPYAPTDPNLAVATVLAVVFGAWKRVMKKYLAL